MSATFLGIDVGTSLIKVCMVDAGGLCLAEAERPVETAMPGAGIAEQDGRQIMADVLSAIAELVEKAPGAAGRIAAISASGQSAGAIGVDRAGNALTPWYPSALDTRIRPQLAAFRQKAGDLLYARNGAWPFTTPRMAWWRENAQSIYNDIALVPSLAGFVLGGLAEVPLDAMAMHPSALTWYGAADMAARAWDDDLIAAFDIDRGLLPQIVPDGGIVGCLSKAAASRTGLTAGIPLTVGLGDTISSLIGANVLQPGEVYSVNGSFTNYLVCLDRCLVDAENEMLQPLASPLDDVWYVILYIGGGGLVHRHMARSLSGGDDADAFALLDGKAAPTAAGADGLFFLPYFLGRSCPPDPGASGGFHGLSLGHGTGHMWRSVMEGLTYDLIDVCDIVKAKVADWSPSVIRITGGGARSDLWCRIQADMLGVPAERLASSPSGPLGAALSAGVAVGAWRNLRHAAGTVRQKSERFEPDRSATAAYAAQSRKRRALIETLEPLWRSAQ